MSAVPFDQRVDVGTPATDDATNGAQVAAAVVGPLESPARSAQPEQQGEVSK